MDLPRVGVPPLGGLSQRLKPGLQQRRFPLHSKFVSALETTAPVSYLPLILFVYLAAVVDTALGEVLRVGNVTPDPVALVAVVWVLLARSRWAFLTAGAVALLGDLIAPGRVGVGAAWMLLVGFGLGRVVPHIRSRHLAVRLPLLLAAMIVWCLGVAVTQSVLGETTAPLTIQLGHAIGAAVYTSAVAVPVLMVAGWIRTDREALS